MSSSASGRGKTQRVVGVAPSGLRLAALGERAGISAFLAVQKATDARDLVQVKYEMLRRVRAQGQPITESTAAFGLSRPSLYQALSAFEQGGLAGLLRKKPGPRRSHNHSVISLASQLGV